MPGKGQPPATAVAADSELKANLISETSTDVCVSCSSAPAKEVAGSSFLDPCPMHKCQEKKVNCSHPRRSQDRLFSSPYPQRISEWTASEVKSHRLFEGEADGREVSHPSAPRDVIKCSSQRDAVPERRKTHKILVTVGGVLR